MTRMFTLCVATLAVASMALTTIGCGKSADGDGKKEGGEAAKPAHPVWGDEDLDARLKALEGKSTISIYAAALFKSTKGMTKLSDKVVFEVKGKDATATASDGRKVTGTLAMKSPCEVKFTVDGMGNGYELATDGDKAWFGLGGAGVKLKNGNWLICGQMRAYITFDGKACTHHKEGMGRGNKWETKSIECSLEGDTFKFKVPKFMKEGEFEEKTLTKVGNVLLSDQMKGDHAVAR